MISLLCGLLLCLGPVDGAASAPAPEVQVAVAANFVPALREIARQFELATGHTVIVSSGSTGRHFAQISAGAPFDVFLAADARRPRLLVEKGLAVADSRFTYAMGQLVFFGTLTDEAGADVLTSLQFDHCAIANPRLAPYGRAAQQVLERLNLWNQMQDKLVRGQNVGQAFQFVASGNAELGLVSRGQVLLLDQTKHRPLEVRPVPANLYDPILQQAVLLTRAADNPGARALLDFLKGQQSRAFIEEHGYLLPSGDLE